MSLKTISHTSGDSVHILLDPNGLPIHEFNEFILVRLDTGLGLIY